ncbi:MAG: anaerobic ribonucleoside-triphosphate reductase activating protein [Lachnospiraceae bacterium]|nr:anaerobic ribonucleoside-triphosphate reductase activating protein [Lachnospiraceae bacterium]
MEIHGFQKTTLLDYPGHLAATVFLGRCNFCCPFCHNSSLVLAPEKVETIPAEEVLATLKKRSGMLEGVCITGGEPTLNPNLRDFIGRIRDLGLAVKLDSNGYKPEVLETLLKEKMLDYVAMDVKGAKDHYQEICGVRNLDISRIEASVNIISEMAPDYEFRTTYVKGLHTEEDVRGIGEWLAGDSTYYIQNYKEGPEVISPVFEGFSEEEIRGFKDILLKTLPNTHIRGDYE